MLPNSPFELNYFSTPNKLNGKQSRNKELGRTQNKPPACELPIRHKKTFCYGLILGTIILSLASPCRSQTPDPQPPGPPVDPRRPQLTPAPAEEDWGFLSDPATKVDWLDAIKYIPLYHHENFYLSFGGEYRGEYERSNSTSFGIGPQDTGGYHLQRLMPHVDLHLGTHLRIFSEFKFDDVFGRNGGPRPGADQDRGDVHQTFAEFGTSLQRKDGTRLRVGRQELLFGTGRLLDNNEGANVKTSFDGVRVIWSKGEWVVNAFAVKPVQINPGVFDDSPNFRQGLWGIYSTTPLPFYKAKLDLYYLGLDTKRATYFSGFGPESRNSFGFRVFNREPGALPTPGYDYNWEAVYQSGSFRGEGIRAWGLATETGHTWHTPLRIRIALRANAASGDSNPSDHFLNTFNPLFPRGAYFGPKLDLVAPYDVYDVHPVIFLHPFRNVTASVDAIWFWRQNVHDGVYSFGGFLFVPGSPSQPRFIGTQTDLEIRWALTPHVTIAINPAGFLAGSFLRDSSPGRNIGFVNIGLTYRF